ncbi:unnamed protein product [Miscanthus lutarioriparius]|uniref:Uncharacterized protein n=1 Tax=Miscanthus lutarioriparius TaxID=422564 RepID=A0A811Q3U0_9POAL|nr:unnamed protein product [Miscanthus lutarioriparius]
MLDRRAAMLVLFSCFLFLTTHAQQQPQPAASGNRKSTSELHTARDGHPAGIQASETVIMASRTAAGGEASDAATELADQPDLVGQVSPLLALDHLEHLDLSENELEGPTGHIPKFLGSLKYLNLSGILLSRASTKFSQCMHESK